MTPTRTLTLNGPDAVRRAAYAGLGVAILSSWCVADDLREGRLTRVNVEPAFPAREYAIVDKELMPSVRGKLTDQQIADLVAYLASLKEM